MNGPKQGLGAKGKKRRKEKGAAKKDLLSLCRKLAVEMRCFSIVYINVKYDLRNKHGYKKSVKNM